MKYKLFKFQIYFTVFAVVIGVQNLFCRRYWVTQNLYRRYWNAKFILPSLLVMQNLYRRYWNACYFASFAYQLGITVLYSIGKRYRFRKIISSLVRALLKLLIWNIYKTESYFVTIPSAKGNHKGLPLRANCRGNPLWLPWFSFFSPQICRVGKRAALNSISNPDFTARLPTIPPPKAAK